MFTPVARRVASAVARRSGLATAAPVRRAVAVAPRVAAATWSPARFMSVATSTSATQPDMLCYQCEQTEANTGCTTIGVCGKDPTTAALQDLLVYNLKGLSQYAKAAREAGAPDNVDANRHLLRATFATLTNVNFDASRFCAFIEDTVKFREERRAAFEAAGGDKAPTAACASWSADSYSDPEALAAEAKGYGVWAARQAVGDDIAGLQELITYGLKGTAAYAAHAMELDQEDPEIYAFIQDAFAALGDNEADVETLLGLALGTGGANLKALAALDAGNTGRYGHPVPTPVNHEPIEGKCILVSGHDLRELEAILEQSAGKGINVYTHGELLPAHGYPGLKEKYPHLVGNYGGPWQMQRFEFGKFPGPIVMTTNCIVEPRRSYADRIYTVGVTGYKGTKHIDDRDFSEVVAQALSMDGFSKAKPERTTLTGFGRNAVLGVADQVLAAAKEGKLKRLVLIGGCDGNEGERSYYTKLAKELPPESIILTLGCGKYRLINKTTTGDDYGVVPGTGLPRLLDMGQCNDSYSAVVVALELAKALDTDVNGLPLTIALSWFEQKAVAVLLTLLHLGVKNIHIGPRLPAFITPAVLGQLVDAFGLVPIGDPEAAAGDAEKFMSS